MMFRNSILRASAADIKTYLYFIVSTGLFQTYSGWVAEGRQNPLVTTTKRKEPTTRTELVRIFDLAPSP